MLPFFKTGNKQQNLAKFYVSAHKRANLVLMKIILQQLEPSRCYMPVTEVQNITILPILKGFKMGVPPSSQACVETVTVDQWEFWQEASLIKD